MKRNDRRAMMFCSMGIVICEIMIGFMHLWSEAMIQPFLTAVLAWCIFVIAYRTKTPE
jgi:hypothetical protein